MKLLSVLGGALTLAAAGAALGQPARQEHEPLGRLFFTPAQRQDLDRRRQLNIQEAVVVNENRFTLNGQVTRSSGKTTTWINGQPQNDVYRPADPGTVAVRTSENEPSVPLKVGETLDKARDVVTDGLEGGDIKVERRAPRTR